MLAIASSHDERLKLKWCSEDEVTWKSCLMEKITACTEHCIRCALATHKKWKGFFSAVIPSVKETCVQ